MIPHKQEVMHRNMYLHEYFFQMPALPRTGTLIAILLSDLCAKHRTEPVPLGTQRLVTDIDLAFAKKVFHLLQRKRKTHGHHHRKADDLGRRLEAAEWIGHAVRRRPRQHRPEPNSSDTALENIPDHQSSVL